MKKTTRTTGCLILFLLFANGLSAEMQAESTVSKHYSPKVGKSYPLNIYWGDTHVHSNLSSDAYSFGNTALGPEEAYRFAKGKAVQANNGMTAKLSRPLDFLVVADHASSMGTMKYLEGKSPIMLSTALGKQWVSRLEEINKVAGVDITKSTELALALSTDVFINGGGLDDQVKHSVWKEAAILADHHNIPGKFTAFIGYEWTQSFYNLHRVVIFNDGAEKAGQLIPFSQYDSSDPEALWRYLDSYESKIKGEVLAIPHNGNLSQGVMFALEDVDGSPLSVDYAKSRSRWEPLFEVTQIKGDSEAHPDLSSADEFADYETIPPDDTSNELKAVQSQKLKKELNLTHYDSWVKKKSQEAEKSWHNQYGYARPALKLGLRQQAKLGVNPFKFGMIGSTDSHTSLATADEDNFFGELTWVEPYSNRVMGSWLGPGLAPDIDSWGYFASAWRMSASGYAAVWAEENTRESLFAAMKGKEVYASTGPRIKVRFFGGWDYQTVDAFKPDLAGVGYAKGVPMGGDLTHAPEDKSPNFLISAVKDPDGANLDRVQVIKGWHDQEGELHEKLYNVALSDNRKENWRGKVKSVGNTVNIPDASYTNTIGDPELAVVWQDPDFNKNELAFYYVRVLEIPTPRWTAYDAKFFQLKDLPSEPHDYPGARLHLTHLVQP